MRTYTAENFVNSSENISVHKSINKSGVSEPIHKHEFIELVYIVSGCGTQQVDGCEYDVSKGNMLFINYNQSHSFSAENELIYVNLLMKPEFMSKELINSENIYEIFSLAVFGGFDISDKKEPIVKFEGKEILVMEQIIENCIYEFEKKHSGYITVLQSYMQIIFTMLMRNIQRKSEHMGYIKPVMPEIIKYIAENYSEKLTLKTLADKCFYNPAYFSRIFKECYGKTVTSYIREIRISKAIEMLENTDLATDNIIETVGYNDKALFYKHFKEYTGTTPAALKKTKKSTTK